MVKTYNEGAAVVLLVEFFDENGDPVTPDAAWYTVDEPVSGTRVVEATTIPIAPFQTSAIISIVSGNTFVNPSLPYEARRFTVQFRYDTPPKPGVVPYEYRLKRMPGLAAEPV